MDLLSVKGYEKENNKMNVKNEVELTKLELQKIAILLNQEKVRLETQYIKEEKYIDHVKSDVVYITELRDKIRLLSNLKFLEESKENYDKNMIESDERLNKELNDKKNELLDKLNSIGIKNDIVLDNIKIEIDSCNNIMDLFTLDNYIDDIELLVNEYKK